MKELLNGYMIVFEIMKILFHWRKKLSSFWENTFFFLLFKKKVSKKNYLSTQQRPESCLPSMQIGWIYGSVTEDILTGFKMHCRGWKSVYCVPKRAAFKGSAPINLSDRLHQVLRWALGSVEIFLSRHCPLWYGYGGKLKWLERFAYTNTIVYPFTSIPLLAYCTIPAVCLLTGKFIIPTVSSIVFAWVTRYLHYTDWSHYHALKLIW